MMPGGLIATRGLTGVVGLVGWVGWRRCSCRLVSALGVLAGLVLLVGCQESLRESVGLGVPAATEDSATGDSATEDSAVLTTSVKPGGDSGTLRETTSTSGRKLWLGIQAEPAPKVLLDQFELSCGLVVRQVVPGGPSEGLLQVSDLITQFNGRDLACQKLLCNMIAEVGAHVTQLTVIRKAKQLQVAILPQPIEVLGDGQIVQYTVLADPDSADVVDVPVDGDQVVEKFRLFVVQPILDMGPDYDQQKLGADPGQLQLERVVKFGTNEQGQPMMTVQESGRTLFYTAGDIEKACPEVQQLWQRLENQP